MIREVLRWLKRIVLGMLALVAVAIVAGSAYEAYARRAALRDHPARGVLVDVGGGRRLHLDCRGAGAPTVVLEAGLDITGSLAWSAVHDPLAARVRTCAYDRAGIMWSDRRPRATDAGAIVADLHAALAAAREPGPYVLAGHSLAGPLMMNYARLHPDEVAGVVFVDASHPDQMERLAAAGVPAPNVAVLKAIVALRWTGIGRLPLLGGAPPGMPPAAVTTARAFGLESGPGAVAELEALPTILAQGGELRTLGDRPIHVLTARRAMSDDELRQAGFTREQADRLRTVWKELQEDEASWSTDSRHDLVDDAAHYVQFDRPDLVIAAVEGVVQRVRARAAGTSGTPPATESPAQAAP